MDINQIRQKIDKAINDLSKKGLNKNRFIKDQYDVVLKICDNIVNHKKKAIVIEAPTGTGKSIISMVSALVLNRCGKTGYIVTSDLHLQKQYEDDFKNFGLTWGSIKGVDNYNCTLNDEKFSIGECQQRGLNLAEIEDLDCALKCPYMSTRRNAVNSKTALLNYSYWLLQQNYVNKDGHGAFKERDFCFFDECHKITGIVQNHFSPLFTRSFETEMKTLLSMIDDRLGFKDYVNEALKYRDFFNTLEELEDTKLILESLIGLELKLEGLLFYTKPLKDRLKEKYPISVVIPKNESIMIKKLDWLKDIHCKVEDFIEVILKTSHDNIVKVTSDNKDIQLKNIEEKYLMENHFHKYCNSQVFLSATIGDHLTFCELNMIKDYDSIEVESLFDFKKSPICVYYPQMKMTYREKDASFPTNLDRMHNILNYHKNDRGIIHSGSYSLTQLIIDNTKSDRLIPYFSSSQKPEALEKLEKSKNGILIGPSILEGVDLKDDLSRFQIFFKVPYMSLGDEFVKKKMNKYPEWYQWNAIINAIQGIGRSIRNNNDYAKTYLIDGSFNDLIIGKSLFPDYILDRIHIVDDARKKVTKVNRKKSFIG